MTKPNASIVYVDAPTAQRWLSKNSRNRNLNPSVVRRYAADMSAGRWPLTGEPVKFDAQGNLLDGQHRLAAIVAADVTLPIFVVRGLDESSQAFMDTGRKRTVQDQLSMSGHRNPAILAAAGRLALRWETNRLNTARNEASDAEVRQFIRDNPPLIACADLAGSLVGRLDMPPSVVATAAFGLSKANGDLGRVAGWFADLADMRTSGAGDPKAALLHRFSSARRSRERISAEAALSLVVRAWNAEVQGKSMHRMPVVSRNGGNVNVPAVLRAA